MSKDKPVFEVPKEIRELAQKFCKERTTKEQAERLAKQKRDAEQKRIRAGRLKTGLKYATKIFLWAEALRKSDTAQELIKRSHPPTAYSSIFFFDGHIAGIEWVGLGISPDNLFLTRAGRMSYIFRQPLSSPEDLAKSVETVTLQLASEWIDNGEVWLCIKRRFNYLPDE